MDAERVGREQSVIPHVPWSRMDGIRWMIEDCDPHRFAVDLAPVITPLRTLAPCPGIAPGGWFVVAQAGAHHDVSGARLALSVYDAHLLVHAHGHGPFLRVAEEDVAVRGCLDRDFEIKQTFILRAIVNPEG